MEILLIPLLVRLFWGLIKAFMKTPPYNNRWY